VSERRNILFISLDDAFAYWKYRSAFGAELQTPNLDRICAVSTAFQSAYCQVPVCGPSRSSFMSALSPCELGIFDNYTNVFSVLRPEQMWSFRLKQAGYHCSTGGKVHHGYKPLPPEIHEVLYSHPAETFNIGPGRNAEVREFGGLMRGQGTIDPAYDDRYYDAQSAASAVRFLDAYDGAAPFYREVGFYHPHSPYKTPVRFKEMYDPALFRQPPEWAGGHDRSPFPDLYMRENIDSADLALWQKSVRNYFSAFSHVDEHIGRVWDALKASPHADDTIVVILADHGYHPGDKNRFRKFTLWEEAAGVPLIVHDPSRPQGRVVADPVALLDVGPTVLDYAGCPPIAYCAGRSLRPQVEGGSAKDRAVPTFFFGSAAIRKGDHRYIRYQDGSCQLYDLRADPWQLRDISGNATLRRAMHAALVETCRDYGLELLDPANTVPRPNAFVAIPDGVAAPGRLTGLGAMSTNSLSGAEESPGARTHFATLKPGTTLRLPDGVRTVQLAADYRINIDRFPIAGNDHGNVFNFVGGHNRFVLDVDCGRGDDVVMGQLDELSLRLNAGNNTVLTGHTGATVFGGSGRDVIETANGTNVIHGGAGDLVATVCQGQDTVHTAAGTTHLRSTGGITRIVINQGMAEIDIEGGEIALIFGRTGLPQTVRGFEEGSIDLSDWAVLGAAEVESDGQGGAVITAGTERVRFVGVDAARLRTIIGLDPLP
jgi:arylsulfatase A-like enzyme